MNSKQKTVAVYIRVSTEKQEDNTSKENQLEVINSYINYTWGNSNVKTIIYDDTMSASLPPKNLNSISDYSYNTSSFYEMIHRPELKRMLFDAELKKFSDVLVYSHDRLSRNEYETFIIKYALKKFKVEIHYCKAGESLNSDSKDMNELVDDILEWYAINEATTLSRRAKEGAKRSITLGLWTGGPPPFGYKLELLVGRKKQSVLKIDHISASVVKRIFELYLLGYSPNEIAKRIEKENPYFSNKKWAKDTILDILKNPTYTGYLTWNKRGGEKKSNRHSPNDFIISDYNKDLCIIEKEIWDKAKALREYRKSSSKVHSTPFLLKGIVKCYHCGEPLKCKNHGNSTGRVYLCGNSDCRKILSIKADKLHEIIIDKLQEELEALARNDLNLEILFSAYMDIVNDKNTKTESQIISFKSEIDEKNNLIKNCDDKISQLQNIISSSFSKDYELIKSNHLIDSIRDTEVITKNEITFIEKEICQKESTKLRVLSSKEELKMLIGSSKLSLENILKESSEKVKIQKLRIFLVNIFDSIIIEENYSLKLIFK